MNIASFLHAHKALGSNAVLTHLSLNGGKYFIPESELEQFYDLYIEAEQQNYPLYLAEKLNPGDKFCLYLDIDFEPQQFLALKRQCQGSTCSFSFYKGLQQVLQNVLSADGINIMTSDVHVAVRLPHKIHVHVPSVVVTITRAVTYMNTVREMFSHFINTAIEPEVSIETLAKIFDGGVYRSGLRMLGSRKRGGSDWYRLVNFEESVSDENDGGIVFHPLTKEVLKKTVIRTYLVDHETLHNDHHNVLANDVNVDEAMIQRYVNELVPQIGLSEISEIPISKIRLAFGHSLSFVALTRCRYCPFARRQHRRQSDYLYFFINNKGARLKCYNEECRELSLPVLEGGYYELNQELRVFYTDQDPRYELTSEDIDTLNYFCGTNFEINKDLVDMTTKCFTSPSHANTANVLFKLMHNRIRCSLDSKQNTEWYELRQNCLKQINHCNSYVVKLISAFSKMFIRFLANNPSESGAQSTVPGDTTQPQPQVTTDKIINWIENYSNHKNLFLALANVYSIAYGNWIREVDSNPDIVCFKNGILELENQMSFRPGQIDDKVMNQMNGNYIDYDPGDLYVHQVMQFFQDLFPCEGTRDYILKSLARCLSGRREEDFFILTGNGANGKSKLVALISKTFGDYWADIPVSLFTNKRSSSNAASPEVMSIKGKRICTLQEPENNAALNMGLIKQMCGNDFISARALYQNQQQFRPQASFFLCCNNIPEISYSDGGTWRRIKVITMRTQFVDNPRLPFQKRKDPLLEHKMEHWSDAFLSILGHYYIKFQREGMRESEDMLADKAELRRDVDFVSQFLESELEPVENDQSLYTNFLIIYAAYQSMCKRCDTKPLNKTNFHRAIMEKYLSFPIPGSRDFLIACKLKTNNDHIN